jgi:hypothetical protein
MTKERRTDELCTALADGDCRQVLNYFQHSGDDTASLEELAAFVTNESDSERRRTLTVLHHITLPKLDDVDVLAYDPGSRTVRYHDDECVEAVLDDFAHLEEVC